MNKPTVGRLVHFYPENDAETPRSALITEVSKDGVTQLHVFDNNTGNYYVNDAKQSGKIEAGTWSWPPVAPKPEVEAEHKPVKTF